MTKPLDGLLVVALEQAVAAPYCSSRLADAGARVIKIERAEGDFARRYDHVVNGESAYFVWLNRGKQSIALDIKDPDDAALLQRILAKADVFIQNLLPGAAARAGFGSDDLRARYPRLITCDISGYGDDAAYRDRKAYDLLVQAETGLCSLTGTPEAPGRVGVSVCDIAAGMYAYQGILEALIGRGVTGQGKGLAVSLFDGMADWMAVPLLHFDYGGSAPVRVGLAHPSIAPYGVFSARDGVQILISIQNEREWRRLCAEVLEDAAMADAPQFKDNPTRVAHRPELDGRVADAFAKVDGGELGRRLDAAGIAYGLLNGIDGLSRHPVLRRITVETPGGPVNLPAPPTQTKGAAPSFGPVPAIDQDGPSIRQEFAP